MNSITPVPVPVPTVSMDVFRNKIRVRFYQISVASRFVFGFLIAGIVTLIISMIEIAARIERATVSISVELYLVPVIFITLAFGCSIWMFIIGCRVDNSYEQFSEYEKRLSKTAQTNKTKYQSAMRRGLKKNRELATRLCDLIDEGTRIT